MWIWLHKNSGVMVGPNAPSGGLTFLCQIRGIVYFTLSRNSVLPLVSAAVLNSFNKLIYRTVSPLAINLKEIYE